MLLTSMAIDACSESGKGNGAITSHQLLFLMFPLQKMIIHLWPWMRTVISHLSNFSEQFFSPENDGAFMTTDENEEHAVGIFGMWYCLCAYVISVISCNSKIENNIVMPDTHNNGQHQHCSRSHGGPLHPDLANYALPSWRIPSHPLRRTRKTLEGCHESSHFTPCLMDYF